jgi:hypothetical protein
MPFETAELTKKMPLETKKKTARKPHSTFLLAT